MKVKSLEKSQTEKILFLIHPTDIGLNDLLINTEISKFMNLISLYTK